MVKPVAPTVPGTGERLNIEVDLSNNDVSAVYNLGWQGNNSGTPTGGNANMNPAMARYTNIMGGPSDGSGGILNFNASSCYP